MIWEFLISTSLTKPWDICFHIPVNARFLGCADHDDDSVVLRYATPDRTSAAYVARHLFRLVPADNAFPEDWRLASLILRDGRRGRFIGSVLRSGGLLHVYEVDHWRRTETVDPRW